jgi:predicted dehydrogenase
MMSQNQNSTTRRDFLRTAAVTTAGAAAVSSMPTTAEAMRRVVGANDRISIGHVGVGGQGLNTHVKLLHEAEATNNTQQIAVCDVYGKRTSAARAMLGLKESAGYSDYRKLVERKDIDAVVIATSDNWHADVTLASLAAGKHVYCEKPLCRTLEEAFTVYDAVKKSGKVFQLGTQGCSDDKWHAAGRVVKANKIGAVVVGQGSYMRNSKAGGWNEVPIDAGAGPQASGDAHIDWETFRHGKGPEAWDPDRYFRWRKYWSYGSGMIGDLFPHRLVPLLIAMNVPTTGLDGYPLRVSSGGGLYVQKINPDTGKPDREIPDFVNLNVDFGNMSMMLMSSTCNDVGWEEAIRGNKATVIFGGNAVQIKPQRDWADDVDEGTEPITGQPENFPTHQKNWLDCIRTNGTPTANIELAVRSQVMLTLSERSYRESKTFVFDPATRKASPA